MKSAVVGLAFLFFFSSSSVSHAMNDQEIVSQDTPILQLPKELLRRMSSFVAIDSIRDLVRFGRTCKYLRNLLLTTNSKPVLTVLHDKQDGTVAYYASDSGSLMSQDLLNDRLSGAMDAACYDKMAWLIDRGAHYKELNTLLTYTIGNKESSCKDIGFLLKLNVTPRAIDVWMAIQQDNVSLVKQLLQMGAPATAEMLNFVVTGNKKTELAQLLINHGVDVMEHYNGNQPLSLAKSRQMVRLLIKNSPRQANELKKAMQGANIAVAIELLRHHYPFETAFAIVIGLMIVAPALKTWCAVV